jgi:hypothetical protein
MRVGEKIEQHQTKRDHTSQQRPSSRRRTLHITVIWGFLRYYLAKSVSSLIHQTRSLTCGIIETLECSSASDTVDINIRIVCNLM